MVPDFYPASSRDISYIYPFHLFSCTARYASIHGAQWPLLTGPDIIRRWVEKKPPLGPQKGIYGPFELYASPSALNAACQVAYAFRADHTLASAKGYAKAGNGARDQTR